MSRLAAPKIDRSKLQEAIGKLGDEYVFYLLDEALDLVPEAKLAKLVGKYLDVKDLRLDAGTRIDLFADVETFKTRSLAGGFYEDFNVNSKNCMELSRGTRAWIAQCCRLFDSIVEMPAKSDAGKVAAAFEVLLAGVEMAARAATGGPAAAGPAGSQSVFSTRGPKPTLDTTSTTTGGSGTKGAGGLPTVNDGIDGQKTDALQIQ